MTATTARVTKLLNGQSDTDENETADAGDSTGDEATAMSRSDLKAAVKEGVTEALEERDAATETDDEADDQTSGEETSSGRSRLPTALKLLASLGTVATLAYLQRRRGENQDDEQSTD